jgi:acetate kinase
VRVLSVNAGSTSLKIERYDLTSPLPPIAQPPQAVPYPTLQEAMHDGPELVAHRFVRLPDDAPDVLLLDEATISRIAGVASDAPLHDTPALRAVAAIRSAAENVPQYAVSDSGFHRTLPPAAATYALPRDLTRRGFRRRGYHGLSHEYAAHRACALAGVDVGRSGVVTLHLGGGSSLCAVRDGASIDTTMGYTPLEGVPMATRSGSVDPGLVVHLLREGISVDELEETLERRSGMLGISGRSGDVRELLAADDADARLALEVFVWRVRAALGAMIAVLGTVDLVAFTGGIGEHAALLRTAILEGAAAWGATLSADRNASLAGEGRISSEDSRVPVFVITAREGWQLARAVAGLG